MTKIRKYVKRGQLLEEKLNDCRGVLKNIATPDSDAIRRYSEDDDGDGWMSSFMRPFERDKTKALRSKMMRRLGNKPQVITLPLNSHVRDRQDHSFEAAAVSTDICSILGLNESLAFAGMIFHDGAHMPGGHAAESFLTDYTGKNWRHNVLHPVLAQQVERKGKGLNLTWQVMYLILHHSRGPNPASVSRIKMQECAVGVKADKIAYTFSDINDIFKRGALISQGFCRANYPEIVQSAEWFGLNQREREFTCIANLCIESAEKGRISFDECEAAVRFEALKKMMYEQVYTRIDRRILNLKMEAVYNALDKVVGDEVDTGLVFALMDDQEFELLFKKIASHEIISSQTLNMISVGEIIPHIRGRVIDIENPDLDWGYTVDI